MDVGAGVAGAKKARHIVYCFGRLRSCPDGKAHFSCGLEILSTRTKEFSALGAGVRADTRHHPLDGCVVCSAGRRTPEGRPAFPGNEAVAVKQGHWCPAGSQKDEISGKTFFVDDRSALERGKDGAFGLGEPKSRFYQRIDHQRGIDGRQELFEAGSAEAEKRERLRHPRKGG